jgi:putative endonuclease
LDKIKKGKFGEKQALKYLVKHGYNIIDYNYYSRYGEIDIIATYMGCYVFVEVKTRSSAEYGTPAESVSISKQRKMSKTALDYISKKNLFDTAVRFDVVEVFLTDIGYNINHIQNAFEEVL